MRQQMQKYYIAFAVLAAICLGAIIWHYAISRGSASDQQKVMDIVELQKAIDSYSQANDHAPDKLSQLDLEDKLQDRLDNYEYSPNTDTYTICATFATDASNKYYASDSDPYAHKKGRQCFTSDLQLYDSTRDPYQLPDYDFDTQYNRDSLQFD